MLRYVVPYIADDSDFKQMMLIDSNNPAPATLTIDELKTAQEEAKAVLVPDEILDHIIQVRNELKKEGVINSDRRYKQSLDILKAHAYLNGRKAVGEEDLAILQHILWSQPAEIKTVQRVIMSSANPLLNKVLELMDQAQEVNKHVMDSLRDNPEQASSSGVEANAKLKKIGEQLVEHKATAQTQGRSTTRIDEAIAQVAAMNKQVLKDCLGLSL
ncbi:MAG: hypothetical protein IBX40_11975 [Methanosarcinales archaeon]|nr:hypothetical protein [Methanosarcinales archaeon]